MASHLAPAAAAWRELPTPAAPRLERDRLVSRLRRLPPGGVALLVAPPGYGGTSLMSLAAEGVPEPVLWESAASAGGAAAQFWGRVSARAYDTPAPDRMLIVDDLPGDEDFERLLQQFLDGLAPNLRVMLRAKAVPRLDLSRLLSSGRLMLLDRADLALTPEESQEYVRAVAPDLPAERRAALVAACGGWIGALRASLTATGADPGSDPAAWLLGPGLALLLWRSVQQLDPVDRELLVTCSVLDRLSPEACDAMLGRTDSAARLASLRDQLLITGVAGADLVQYEVDRLLREYLRRRLAERGRGALGRAHRAASLWLAQQGDAEGAISHLLDCGEIERAREVLAGHLRSLLDTGRSDRVRAWYRRAPELAVPDQHLHLLGAAWAEVLSGDTSAARPHSIELAAAAAQMSATLQEGDRSAVESARWLQAEALLLRAYLEAWDGHTAAARGHVARFREHQGGEWSRMSHQSAAFLEARLDLWHGDEVPARELLLQLSGRAGTLQYYRQVAIPSLGALLAVAEGRAHRARFLADTALDAVDGAGRIGTVDDCDARLARARAMIDLAEVAAADAEAAAMERAAAAVGHVPYQVLAAATRALAAAAGGDPASAQRHLGRARLLLRQRGAGSRLAESVDRVGVDVAIGTGNRSGARKALELLPPGRARDRLAIRVAGMAGALHSAEVVRLVRAVGAETPREVVDARMLMAALSAPSRPAEAQMHLRQSASVAEEHGTLMALLGRSPEVITLAERMAQRGEDPAVIALVGALRNVERPVGPIHSLSRGERDLLARLATAQGNRELAADLGISTNTLKTRLRRLYAKLGVHDRAAALRSAGSLP